MTTNPFIVNFGQSNEQDLYEDLIIESIQMHGIDISYLPRELKNYDEIYGTDAVSEYNSNYTIEAYIKSVDGFEGDGTFLSKFGLEIRDQITLSVAMSRFDTILGLVRDRPQEGDLVYFPLGNRMFKIMFVNHRPQFYALGQLNVYDLVCETFTYGSEKLNTGIAYVDGLELTYSEDTNITGNTNFDVPFDSSSDGKEIQSEANAHIDFSEENPFGDLT